MNGIIQLLTVQVLPKRGGGGGEGGGGYHAMFNLLLK